MALSTTEAEQQLTHLANALPMLAGLDAETRAELLERTGEFAQSYAHPDADPSTVQVDFLCDATRLLRGPLLPPAAALVGGEG